MTIALEQALSCAEKGLGVVALQDGVPVCEPLTERSSIVHTFNRFPRASAAIALGRVVVVEATDSNAANEWCNEHFNELGNGHALAVASDTRYSGPKRRWFFTTNSAIHDRAIVDGVLLRARGFAVLGEPWEWRPGNPRSLETLPDWLHALGELDILSAKLADELFVRYSDTIRAERFANRHRDRVRHVANRGWMMFSGGRWTANEAGAQLAVQLDSKELAAAALTDKEIPDQHRAAILNKLLSRNSIRSVEELARPHLAVSISQLDSHPLLLNCKNGTLDLEQCKLRPHQAEDLHTKWSPVNYDPTAEAPQWMAFLEQVLPDRDVREYVQRFVGYSLTGVIREHTFPIFFGSGGNGKGTFLHTIAHVLGDYARTISPDMLMQREREDHKAELTYLIGARLAIAQETQQNRRLDENKLKTLTGGDPINARFMYGNPFEFLPTHKIVLATNNKPVVRGTDEGIWRRIALVPWTVKINEDKKNTKLDEALRAEAPGILRWCVEGCRQWQAIGLKIPVAIQATTQEYRSTSDVIGRFLAERTTRLPTAKVQSAKLHEEFKRWCAAEGETACSGKAFSTELVDRHGCEPQRKGGDGRMWFHGVGLLAPAEGSESSVSSDKLREKNRSENAITEDTEDSEGFARSRYTRTCGESLENRSEPSVSSVGGEQGTEAGIVPTPPTENATSENRILDAVGESGDSGDHVSGSSYTHAHIEMNAEGGPHTPHSPPTALGDVLARCFNLDAEGRVAFRAIASAWQEHCRNAGIEAGPDAWLSNELEARGFTFAGYNVVGLRLKEAPAATPPTSEVSVSVLVKPRGFHPLREFLENSFVFAHGATVAFEDVWRTWNAHAIGANLHPNTREWLREQLEEHGYDIDAVGDVHGLLAPAEGSAA